MGTHFPAIPPGPVAHTSKRSDDGPPQLGQGIFDSHGLRPRHAPGDESREFEMAKSSRQHPLGDASEAAAQLTVPIRSVSKREENLRRPPADENRPDRFRFVSPIHNVLPRAKVLDPTIFGIYLSQLLSRLASSHLASACMPGAIRNTCVPRAQQLALTCESKRAELGGDLDEQHPQASTADWRQPARRSHSGRDGGARTS